MRFETSRGFVEHHQVFFDHRRKFLNDFHSVSLNTNCGRVSRWMCILKLFKDEMILLKHKLVGFLLKVVTFEKANIVF
jgi:hypothetical protein